MFLHKLWEYSKQIDTPPIGYSIEKVRWVVHVSDWSHYIEELRDDSDGKKGKSAQGCKILVPEFTRSGTAAKLVSDTSEYVYEGGRKGYRKSYLELLRNCWEETQHPSIKRVMDYCYRNPKLPERFSPKFDERVAFWDEEIGQMVTSIPEIMEWWSQRFIPSDLPLGQCCVSGGIEKLVKKRLLKLKGVPGGSSYGSSLISSYCESFQSYGNSQAASIGVSVDNDIHQALNYLLQDKERCFRLGGMAILLWGTEFGTKEIIDVIRCMDFLKSPKTGKQPGRIPDVNLLALKGNAGRTSVRAYFRAPESEIINNLTAWMERQEIPGFGAFENRKHLSVFYLAAVALNNKSDKMEALMSSVSLSLLQSALFGVPLPSSLLGKLCNRNRKERTVTWARAILINQIIKLYRKGEMRDMDLKQSVAYHYGRLLAIYASLENAVRRSEGSNMILAETRAARVFPLAGVSSKQTSHGLASRAQYHLKTLARKKDEGSSKAARFFEKEIAACNGEIANLGGLPDKFSLDQQAHFDLGYSAYINENRSKS
jgi:CRISPR-associated protein Csd1